MAVVVLALPARVAVLEHAALGFALAFLLFALALAVHVLALLASFALLVLHALLGFGVLGLVLPIPEVLISSGATA